MQVWALRNPDGSFRAKFHRHDSFDCRGRRMREETYAEREDYVLVDIADLLPHQQACQFCFPGQPDAQTVAGGARGPRSSRAWASSAPAARPARGVRPGQVVAAVDLATGQDCVWRISASTSAIQTSGRVSPQSPIGRALLGHQPGEIVIVDLPRGQRRLQISDVWDPPAP